MLQSRVASTRLRFACRNLKLWLNDERLRWVCATAAVLLEGSSSPGIYLVSVPRWPQLPAVVCASVAPLDTGRSRYSDAHSQDVSARLLDQGHCRLSAMHR